MYKSGESIDICIEGWSNFVTDGPWCKVFHHSTEKWIIGILTKPTIVRSEVILTACLLSEKDEYKAIMPIYKNKSIMV